MLGKWNRQGCIQRSPRSLTCRDSHRGENGSICSSRGEVQRLVEDVTAAHWQERTVRPPQTKAVSKVVAKLLTQGQGWDSCFQQPCDWWELFWTQSFWSEGYAHGQGWVWAREGTKAECLGTGVRVTRQVQASKVTLYGSETHGQ